MSTNVNIYIGCYINIIMSKQNKVGTEKRREMSKIIYAILDETRMEAESLDERDLESMSYSLVNKIVDIVEGGM